MPHYFFQNKVLPVLERAYDRFINVALKGWMPGLIFMGTIGLLIASLALLAFNSPKVVFFPSGDPLYVKCVCGITYWKRY